MLYCMKMSMTLSTIYQIEILWTHFNGAPSFLENIYLERSYYVYV